MQRGHGLLQHFTRKVLGWAVCTAGMAAHAHMAAVSVCVSCFGLDARREKKQRWPHLYLLPLNVAEPPGLVKQAGQHLNAIRVGTRGWRPVGQSAAD